MNIRKILVPTDFSPNSYMAVEVANELACRYRADVTLLYVDATHEYLVLDLASSGEAEEREFEMHHFEEAKGLMDAAIDVELAVERGTAHTKIVEFARDHEFDVIAMATHGRSGIPRMLLGSTTEKVVRSSECPVLLIHPEDERKTSHVLEDLDRVILPTDLSEVSNRALDSAVALARKFEAKLVLTHVVEPLAHLAFAAADPTANPYPQGIEEATEQAIKKLHASVPDDVDVEVVKREGLVHGEICALGREPGSLIVMASHGHTGVQRWLLGSVTDRVVRTAECPVWVVK